MWLDRFWWRQGRRKEARRCAVPAYTSSAMHEQRCRQAHQQHERAKVLMCQQQMHRSIRRSAVAIVRRRQRDFWGLRYEQHQWWLCDRVFTTLVIKLCRTINEYGTRLGIGERFSENYDKKGEGNDTENVSSPLSGLPVVAKHRRASLKPHCYIPLHVCLSSRIV